MIRSEGSNSPEPSINDELCGLSTGTVTSGNAEALLDSFDMCDFLDSDSMKLQLTMELDFSDDGAFDIGCVETG